MLLSLPSSLSILTYLLCTSTHAYKPLSDSFLKAIPAPGDLFDHEHGDLLAPILIPRVPGTPGQTTTQQHFVSYFQRELPKWDISWQNSTATTPTSGGKDLPFQNLIFKREPPWVKPGQSNLLTLVAHYDSKITPKGFIGATDSAAPCAMLMWVAKVVDQHVQRMYDEMQALEEGGTVEMDMGIQILLLDGEEAFQTWSDTDSLYGARYVRSHSPSEHQVEDLDSPGTHANICVGVSQPNGQERATPRQANSTNTAPLFRKSPSSSSSISSAAHRPKSPHTSPPHIGRTSTSPTWSRACAPSTSSSPNPRQPSCPTST